MVAVSLEQREPAVLVRDRVHLVKNFTYESRQPYHTAAKLDLDEARAFVAHIKKGARALAAQAIRNLRRKLHENGHELNRSLILLASGRPLPSLPKILAAHSLIHTADGVLFREALIHASESCEIEAVTLRERDLAATAAGALSQKPAHLIRVVNELGRGLGPPRSQDEKLAALAVWFALARGRATSLAVSSPRTNDATPRRRRSR